MKKVQVTMPDNEHAALKDYCSAFDVTMSEVMYEAAKLYMHKHAEKCSHIKGIFMFRRIQTDKRIAKECWGEDCLTCSKQVECRVGAYTGSWEKNRNMNLSDAHHVTESIQLN